MSLMRELKRRKVFRVAAAYAVVGWLLIQVATQVFPFFDLPNWSVRLIVLTILAGFPIALVMAWAFDSTPSGIERTPDSGEISLQATRLGGFALALTGIAIALLAGLGYWHFHRDAASTGEKGSGSFSANGNAAQPKAHRPEKESDPISDKSIAVLPFANLSDDKANAFFADGMQDEILTKLSKIAALRVISRTSTQRYASAPENLGEIARQLGVANILEGSVQKAGNAVHINVQLIGAAKDEHLWAESYNRTLDDIFGVEGEVAQAVADALKATLTRAERQVVAAKGTENPAAYEDYLRGRAMDNSSYTFTGTIKAVDNYLAAVHEDPKFAQAWAAAAVAMSELYFNGYDGARSTEQAVREAADTAARLQPDLAETLWARGGYFYWVKRDFSPALELFKRALDKQPGDVDMLASLFFIERRMGRWDDAIAHYRETLARDPRNVSLRVQGAREILFYLRHFDEMRAQLEEALKIAPDDAIARACLAELEQRLGRLDAADAWLASVPKDSADYYESLAHLQQARYRRDLPALTALVEPGARNKDAELTDVDYIGLIFLGHSQRAAGHADLARATFERLSRAFAALPGGVDHVVALAPLAPLFEAGIGKYDEAIAAARHRIETTPDALERGAATAVLAQVLAFKGDREGAIAMLPKLLEMPAGVTPGMLVLDPLWDSIRDDPRFVAFTKQPATEYKVPPHE